jgi:hypothetical protein
MSKEPELKKFIVETVSTYKMRYLIEAENAEFALDYIAWNEDLSEDEVDQHFLSETVINIREIEHLDGVEAIDPAEAAREIDAEDEVVDGFKHEAFEQFKG